MKKFYLISFILILTCTSLFATQNQRVLSAIVKDNQTKAPIEYATVELLTKNDSLLKGCITDSTGYFAIPTPHRTTKIRIRFMGYQTMEIPIKEHDLGVIWMVEDAKSLQEVSIKGNARQNKIDRDVFTITKEMRLGTSTSTELLDKLQGVQFNRYDKTISVNGKTNVLILINGIEKDQNLAKNLSPDRIERIEIIKDPVGKYTADGYSAIINIILKKDDSGIDLLVDNTSFFDLVGTNGKYPFLQDFGNLNFNYMFNKFDFYLVQSNYIANLSLPVSYIKKYNDLISITPPFDFKNPNSDLRRRNLSISVGGDYNASKNQVISVELNYNTNQENEWYQYLLTNSIHGNVLKESTLLTQNLNHNNQWQTTMTYHGTYNDKSNVFAELRYRQQKADNNHALYQDLFADNSIITQSTRYVRFNGTYSYSFSRALSTDVGYGLVTQQSRSQQNDNKFQSGEFRHRFSLYANYKPSNVLRIKAGGMVELYSQYNSNSRQKQHAFMPFLNFMFAPNQQVNIIAKYHSTVNYPDIDQLTPFQTAIDSLMWSIGNPNLKMAINHETGLAFNLLNAITIEPYYRFTVGRMGNIVQQQGTWYYTFPVNATHYERYGVRANFIIPITKQISWKNRLDFFANQVSYQQEKSSQKNYQWNSNLMYINPKAGLSTGFVVQKQAYNEVDIQGFQTQENNLTAFFVQKSLMKDKLNITLLYVPPIKMGLNYEEKNVISTGSYQQTSKTSLYLIKNLIFVEVNYLFYSGRKVSKKATLNNQENETTKNKGLGL